MSKKQEAHHGGAWKVAYADFVTTMMALFMVLWISVQDNEILVATSRYFQNPFHSPLEDHSGIMPFNRLDFHQDHKRQDDMVTPKPDQPDRQIDVSFLNAVAADFYRLMHIEQDPTSRPLDIQVTSDGLCVTLYDRARRPLFVENGAEFTQWGRFVMQNLAWLVDRHQFHVAIDGHTRAHLAFHSPTYTAWELSSDRANAARRSLIYYAVDPHLIDRVSGYADTQPLPGMSPDSEANQRITLNLSLDLKHPGDLNGVPAGAVPIASPAPKASSP